MSPGHRRRHRHWAATKTTKPATSSCTTSSRSARWRSREPLSRRSRCGGRRKESLRRLTVATGPWSPDNRGCVHRSLLTTVRTCLAHLAARSVRGWLTRRSRTLSRSGRGHPPAVRAECSLFDPWDVRFVVAGRLRPAANVFESGRDLESSFPEALAQRLAQAPRNSACDGLLDGGQDVRWETRGLCDRALQVDPVARRELLGRHRQEAREVRQDRSGRPSL